jgi:hypothetical protein
MMSNKSALVRLTNRLGIGQIHTMSDSLRREERLRFTAHELHHRNKNLLAVVQAIANQIGSRSLGLKTFRSNFSSVCRASRARWISSSRRTGVASGWPIWSAVSCSLSARSTGFASQQRGLRSCCSPTPPRTLAWLCTSWQQMRSSTARFQSPKARSPYTGASGPARREGTAFTSPGVNAAAQKSYHRRAGALATSSCSG